MKYNRWYAQCVHKRECGEPKYVTLIACPRYEKRAKSSGVKNPQKKPRNRVEKFTENLRTGVFNNQFD